METLKEEINEIKPSEAQEEIVSNKVLPENNEESRNTSTFYF
jgi:hypothetical protein